MNDKIEVTFTTTETGRQRMSPICMEDRNSVFEIFSNEILMKPYGMFPIEDIEKASEFTQRLIEDREFAIVLKDENKVIGTLGFVDYNKYNSRAEIAFEMMEDYWNKGLMSEAVSVLLNIGFVDLNLNRIEAFIYPSNLASQRLVEKLGFQKEGLLKKRSFQRGKYRDMIIYGLVVE